MRKYSPDFIDQVCRANDIVDIIGEDTFLKRAGEGYMGLCPFPSHNEKTPSFSVSQRKQVYHCFGCGESGNIFTYLQVRRGLRFMEALQSLAQRAGIPVLKSPVSLQAEDKALGEQEKMREVNLTACAFYEGLLQDLPSSHLAKQYLKKRGFSEETIKTFRIGYAEKGWDRLYSHLRTRHEDIKWAVKLGLIKNKEGQYYDSFRERLMFPVLAKNGQDVLGFGGRILTENKSQPKYINSADSSLFHKGETFYGWQNTAPFIRDSGKALVVEGYTDYLSLYQNGFKNMVATLGTALTENHARWLSYQAEQVVLFFDGDIAGEKATQRSLSVLLSQGLTVKFLKLEKGEDPDSFIRKEGKKALEQKMDSAPDLFLSLFLKQLKKYPPGVDRLSLMEKAADIMAGIKKESLRAYYTERVLDSFGLDRKTAQSILNRSRAKRFYKTNFQRAKPPPASKENLEAKGLALNDNKVSQDKEEHGEKQREQQGSGQELGLSLKGASKSELSVLMLALNSPEHYKKLMDLEVMDKVEHGGVLQMFKAIEEHYTKNGLDFQLLIPILIDLLADPAETKVLKKSRYPELRGLAGQKAEIFIQDCFQKIEKEKRQAQLKSLTAHIRADSENTQKYLKKIAKWAKDSPRV